MDAFSARDLVDLATYRGAWCLSLYMPVYRGGDFHQQNPLRLDNLANQAEEQLVLQTLNFRARCADFRRRAQGVAGYWLVAREEARRAWCDHGR